MVNIVEEKFPKYRQTNDFGFSVKVYETTKGELSFEDKINLFEDLYKRVFFANKSGTHKGGFWKFLAAQVSSEDLLFSQKIRPILKNNESDKDVIVPSFLGKITSPDVLEYWIKELEPDLKQDVIWKRCIANNIQNSSIKFTTITKMVEWWLNKNQIKQNTVEFYDFFSKENDGATRKVLGAFIKSKKINLEDNNCIFYEYMKEGKETSDLFQNVLFRHSGEVTVNGIVKRKFNDLLRSGTLNGSDAAAVFNMKDFNFMEYLNYSNEVSLSVIYKALIKAEYGKGTDRLTAVANQVIEMYEKEGKELKLNETHFAFIVGRLLFKNLSNESSKIIQRLEKINGDVADKTKMLLFSGELMSSNGYRSKFSINFKSSEMMKNLKGFIRNYVKETAPARKEVLGKGKI